LVLITGIFRSLLEVSMARWLNLIYIRDKGICQHCFQPVQLDANGPLGPSLDHVIPKSKGGQARPDNLRLVHLTCNAQRGAGLLPEGFDYIAPVVCKICGSSISDDRFGSARGGGIAVTCCAVCAKENRRRNQQLRRQKKVQNGITESTEAPLEMVPAD
jgi:hypothetical protein